MTIDDVRAFIVPIRLRQLARQEGYCEVAVDVRLLADMLAVVDAAEAYVAFWKAQAAAIMNRETQELSTPDGDVLYTRLSDALTAVTRGEDDDA